MGADQSKEKDLQYNADTESLDEANEGLLAKQRKEARSQGKHDGAEPLTEDGKAGQKNTKAD